jgi:hypothetical protein
MFHDFNELPALREAASSGATPQSTSVNSENETWKALASLFRLFNEG